MYLQPNSFKSTRVMALKTLMLSFLMCSNCAWGANLVDMERQLEKQNLIVETLLQKVGSLEKTVKELETKVNDQEDSLQNMANACDCSSRKPKNRINETTEYGMYKKEGEKTLIEDRLKSVDIAEIRRDGSNYQDSGLSIRSIPNQVAFNARLTHGYVKPPGYYKLVFNEVISNSGNHFNENTGVFTVPISGTYVFLWRIIILSGNLTTELAVNNSPRDALYNNAEEKTWVSSTGFAVIHVNTGDVVSIRTGPTPWTVTEIRSSNSGYSTFAGFALS